MANLSIVPKIAGNALTSAEFWRENAAGGWATAAALLLVLFWKLLRTLSGRRVLPTVPPSPKPNPNPSTGISAIISDEDLRALVEELDGKSQEEETWEDVVDKKNGYIAYSAKCCRPKDGPLKYLSVTVFEKCSTELLRDFYMDNEYRKEWDKTLLEHSKLQVDETSGTEVGRMVKKFPLLTPREYILAWRVWEGKDQTFYCIIKDCEHSLAPRQKKYVRIGYYRSGWRIRKVPGRDACEITMMHQEDAGLNIEMAKVAFARGIWSYVCKMYNALHAYSSRNHNQSPSVATMLRLIQRIPPAVETEAATTSKGLSEIPAKRSVPGRQSTGSVTTECKILRKPSKKFIANGLLLLGGVICLSRGRATLGTQLAMACILKKVMKHAPASGQAAPALTARARREPNHSD
ncbi:phosphatidylcholine transfer protein-like [Iris pallida]|uniref:Phosphatidylcholine transfer protein-like n=1 Tax=Iris pallida TaxID=29817 RepID=A0AAX6FDJ2_IRIPA|nr:phosphatidylcholine transfer protein-like [Iris pallida]